MSKLAKIVVLCMVMLVISSVAISQSKPQFALPPNPFHEYTLLNKEDARTFEKLSSGTEPLSVNGERVYRLKEVSQAAKVTLKPEPSYTRQALEKKVHGDVEMMAVFSANGKLRVLYVLKSLSYGLTEQALEAASRIEFKPALLDGRPVSQLVKLEYNFNYR